MFLFKSNIFIHTHTIDDLRMHVVVNCLHVLGVLCYNIVFMLFFFVYSDWLTFFSYFKSAEGLCAKENTLIWLDKYLCVAYRKRSPYNTVKALLNTAYNYCFKLQIQNDFILFIFFIVFIPLKFYKLLLILLSHHIIMKWSDFFPSISRFLLNNFLLSFNDT